MYKFIILSAFSFLFLASLQSCQEQKPAKTTGEEKVKEVQSVQMNSLPENVFRILYEKSDYLDVLFDELPFSISQDDNASIRNLLSHIDNKIPVIQNKNCVPLGHQIYQEAGVILAEADFYVSEGCNYFVFSYQGKKYYNNMMTSGINFYENLKKQNTGQ